MGCCWDSLQNIALVKWLLYGTISSSTISLPILSTLMKERKKNDDDFENDAKTGIHMNHNYFFCVVMTTINNYTKSSSVRKSDPISFYYRLLALFFPSGHLSPSHLLLILISSWWPFKVSLTANSEKRGGEMRTYKEQELRYN